jgi:nicotinamide mononucleotide transporter
MILQYLEYTGVVLGILNVILAARNNIWCWLAGIISSAIYVYLNWQWHLVYDMLLQLFYVVAGFYGWWQWGRHAHKTEMPIIQWSAKQQLPLVVSGTMLSVALGTLTYMYYQHNYITYFDATLTVFSFIATWMMAKKIIDNWIWWIAIDLGGVVLYYLKNAAPTSVLYLFLTLGAVYALLNWRKEQKQQAI